MAGGDGEAASLESLELDPQNGCTPDAPPTLSITSGDAQTLGPDQAGAPLVVAVACQGPTAAVPIAGAVVHWAAETGPSGAGGDVTAGMSTTDGSGEATVGVSGNGTPGRWYVEASAAPPPPVTDAPTSSTTTSTSTSTTDPSTGPVLDEADECSAADPCTDDSGAAAVSVVFDLANTAPAPIGAGPAAPAPPSVATPTAATVPLSDPSLAFTGGPSPLVPLIGASVAVGGLAVVIGFRRRGRRRHRRSERCRAAARP